MSQRVKKSKIILRKKDKMTQMEVTELLKKLESSLHYKMTFCEFDVHCKKLLRNGYLTESGDARLRENRRKQGKSKNSDNYTRNGKIQMLFLSSRIREQEKLKSLLKREKEILEAEILLYKASMIENGCNYARNLFYQSNLYNQRITPIGSYDFVR